MLQGHAVLRAARPLLPAVTVLGCASTSQRLVALTYDDGPHPVHTPAVLDALAGAGAHATFFVLLQAARAHPDLVRRIVDEGHEIALHGVDHSRVSATATVPSVRRILGARTELEQLAGVPVRLYRPAYGAITMPQLVALRLARLDVVLWSAWAQDWRNDPVETLTERVTNALHAGGILLLHDASAGLPVDTDGVADEPTFDRGELTRRLLVGVAERGFEPVTVGQLKGAAVQGRAIWFESARHARAIASAPAA
ncbi:MAG: polysaccharide deacetylase family protein [Dermatophilaceae bacterium]